MSGSQTLGVGDTQSYSQSENSFLKINLSMPYDPATLYFDICTNGIKLLIHMKAFLEILCN